MFEAYVKMHVPTIVTVDSVPMGEIVSERLFGFVDQRVTVTVEPAPPSTEVE